MSNLKAMMDKERFPFDIVVAFDQGALQAGKLVEHIYELLPFPIGRAVHEVAQKQDMRRGKGLHHLGQSPGVGHGGHSWHRYSVTAEMISLSHVDIRTYEQRLIGQENHAAGVEQHFPVCNPDARCADGIAFAHGLQVSRWRVCRPSLSGPAIFAGFQQLPMHEFLAPFESVSGIIDLMTLVLMEIVLGIDNIIFIAIICSYIPGRKNQGRARFIGLMLALVVRIILLSTISFITKMVDPFFHLGSIPVTGRGIILFSGGMFLIIKTVMEIVHKFRETAKDDPAKKKTLTMGQAILQITFIDIVFSFDSIITAVGLSNHIPVMVIAVVISMIVMLLFAPYVSTFIEKYPTIKMLALTFLVVIGLILVLEALEDAHVLHLPEGVNIKTYSYIALLFSLVVELLNIRMRNVKERKEQSLRS